MRPILRLLLAPTLILFATTNSYSQTSAGRLNKPCPPGEIGISLRKAVALDDSLGRLKLLRAAVDTLARHNGQLLAQRQGDSTAIARNRQAARLWERSFDKQYEATAAVREDLGKAQRGRRVWRIVSGILLVLGAGYAAGHH